MCKIKQYNSSDAIQEKHKAIRNLYYELLAKEKLEDPIRSKYIAKAYYVEIICQNPMIGLSRNYIHTILNDRK